MYELIEITKNSKNIIDTFDELEMAEFIARELYQGYSVHEVKYNYFEIRKNNKII